MNYRIRGHLVYADNLFKNLRYNLLGRWNRVV